jgi:hypothetical protein
LGWLALRHLPAVKLWVVNSSLLVHAIVAIRASGCGDGAQIPRLAWKR